MAGAAHCEARYQKCCNARLTELSPDQKSLTDDPCGMIDRWRPRPLTARHDLLDMPGFGRVFSRTQDLRLSSNSVTLRVEFDSLSRSLKLLSYLDSRQAQQDWEARLLIRVSKVRVLV